MLQSQDLEFASAGQYTAFANAIKQELANKLASNPVIQAHEDEFARISKMKDIFAQINATKKEAEQEED